MFFPAIENHEELTLGPLKLVPVPVGLDFLPSDPDTGPEQFRPILRTFQGYLLLRAVLLDRRDLWHAARLMEGTPGRLNPVRLEEYEPLPRTWGWEKGAVSLFDLAVTLDRDRDRVVALYQAYLALFRGDERFQPLRERYGDAKTEAFLRRAEYLKTDPDDRTEQFGGTVPEPVSREEQSRLLGLWCRSYQSLVE